jgi:hypothetical protein
LDGSLATTLSIPANARTLRIGADSDGLNRFTGLIDEVEIFNLALTADEISAIYNAETAGKCVPPYTLTVTMAGTGTGTVSCSPNPVNYNSTSTCSTTPHRRLSYSFHIRLRRDTPLTTG